MRESVIYQDILQQGVEKGVEQGQKQALKTSIFDALEVRFNAVPPEIGSKLEGEGLTPENLRALLRQALTCASLDEFISQLA